MFWVSCDFVFISEMIFKTFFFNFSPKVCLITYLTSPFSFLFVFLLCISILFLNLFQSCFFMCKNDFWYLMNIDMYFSCPLLLLLFFWLCGRWKVFCTMWKTDFHITSFLNYLCVSVTSHFLFIFKCFGFPWIRNNRCVSMERHWRLGFGFRLSLFYNKFECL